MNAKNYTMLKKNLVLKMSWLTLIGLDLLNALLVLLINGEGARPGGLIAQPLCNYHWPVRGLTCRVTLAKLLALPPCTARDRGDSLPHSTSLLLYSYTVLFPSPSPLLLSSPHLLLYSSNHVLLYSCTPGLVYSSTSITVWFQSCTGSYRCPSNPAQYAMSQIRKITFLTYRFK